MFTQKNLAKGPIENGDAGLVIKGDGSGVVVFNTFDLSNIDNITEEQIETMKNLAALSFALSQADIMEKLKDAVEVIIAGNGGNVFTHDKSHLN